MSDVLDFIWLEVEHRPKVKENPIPVEALVRSAPRLKQPDACHRFGKHPLQMRQLHNAARLIPHRRQIAHFRNREQPLIFGVIVGLGMQQVNIFHRRQPLNPKVFQAPQMQPFGHHGMNSAKELCLFIGAPEGLIREALHAGYALAATWPRDCHYDALDRPRKASLVDPGANFLLRQLRIGQRAGIPKVEINDDVVFCRHLCEARAHRAYRFVKSVVGSMSSEDVDAPSILYVFCRDRAMSIYRHGVKVGERLPAIISRRNHFQHQLAQAGIGGGKSAGEKAG